MQLVEIRGRTMREALERASAEVGGRAVVLSNRSEEDGTVVIGVRPTLGDRPAAVPTATRAAARAGTRDVERFLAANGASPELVARIGEAVAGRLDEGAHPLDLAAEEIGWMFPVARIPRLAGVTRVIAVVGPAGVGKTSSLVKLAARAHESGRRVAVATLERGRVGAIETWRGHAKLLGFPFVTLRDAPRALDESAVARSEMLLLDTGGHAGDAAELARLRAHCAERADRYAWSTLLVVSATSSVPALEAQTHAALEPCASIVTKLDETRAPVPALEHVLRRGLPVAFLSDGPAIPADLHRPSPEHFADLLLHGRIRR